VPSDDSIDERASGQGRFEPRGAIFDCDGLLVDTRRCWEAAYRAAVAEVGAALTAAQFAALCESLNGASVGFAAERLSDALGREISAEFLDRALTEAVAGEPLGVMPGAERLLAALEGKLPLAVASNAPASVVDAVLRRAGLRERFSHVVSADEVSAPKPDPAVYLEACHRLSIDPASAVAFEDSPIGARSARAAGMFLVAIPFGHSVDFDAEVKATDLWDPKILDALGLGAHR
jgi:HAD superfamily hydrolase (TIGR01509 family)